MKRLVILSVTLFFASSLHSATIRVPADQPTIQAGIDSATTGDTVLVASGLYTGAGNRDITFSGKNIVLKSNSGPISTVIDCEGDSASPHRGFMINSGEDSTLLIEGFTITGGFGDLVEINASGGGIYCKGSSPKIVNCIITANTTVFNGEGAGIYCESSSAKFVNCTITDNITAEFLGGGVHLRFCSTTFVSCLFMGNYAKQGGAMMSIRSAPKIIGCVFDNNSSYHSGGAIKLAESLEGSAAEISQCLFSSNSTMHFGGAIFISHSSPIISNSTFYGNSSESNLGSSFSITSGTSPHQTFPVIENCILAYGDSGTAISVLNGDPQIFCSNIYGNVEGDWVGFIADQADTNGNLSAVPQFCDSANSDFGLAGSSPCAPSNNSCNVLIGAYDVSCLCCEGIRGDVNSDGDDANILDLTHLVDFIFRGSGDPGGCPNESDVNGDGDPANILDLTYLVDVIFRGGPVPPGCE